MGSIHRYIQPVILTMGSMISIWFLICNLQPLQPALYMFTVCLAVCLYLVIKVFKNDLISRAKRHMLKLIRRKYFVVTTLIVITVLGLLARLFFYYRFAYIPTSDPMTFYDSAKTLAEGGSLLGNSYVAFQPYLSAYNNILGIAMRVISDPWLATILLNIFLDILSSIAIYILLKKLLKPGSRLPTLAFGLWLLNPLNIIFSVLSLPVIIVNFFVIWAVLVSYLLIQQVANLKAGYALPLSIILGLILGLGNCFRPIFIVAILALTIVLSIMFLTTNKSAKFLGLFIGCIVLSALIFTGIQRLNLTFVSNQTGLPAAKNPSGWTMYVGSSWESSGQWRAHNNDDMTAICSESLAQSNFDECHAKLRNVAIERYKDYGILMSASLFIRKLYHQAEDQSYFYNAEQSIVDYKTSRTFKLMNIYTVIFISIVFILSAMSLYGLAKYSVSNQVTSPILMFIAIIMIGWFFAFMLVESAPRYSTILYPGFTIFSVLALSNKYASKSTAK